MQQRSDHEDIKIATLLITDWIYKYENLGSNEKTGVLLEQLERNLYNNLNNLKMGRRGEQFAQLVLEKIRKHFV